MISLGDVNFALGADTRDLQRSVQDLQRFGRTVEQVQQKTSRSANQTAADFRKQEQAIVNALNSTLRLNSQMRKVEGGGKFADQASRGFRDLNQYLISGQRNTLEFQRAMERFRTTQQNATRGFRDFALAQTHVNGLAGAMKGLQSSMVLIQGPLGGIATRISTISSMMGQTGFATAAFVAGFAAAGTAIYSFGKTLLDAGKQVNAFMGQLTAVTGNVEQSAQMLEKLTGIARQSGQRLQDLGMVYARFTIAANGTGMTMAQVDDAFTSVASAATKLQLSQEQTVGVFRALEQMMSKGTVQAEELRGQLGDRLPGAIAIMSRALGVSTAKLGDMMKKGLVESADAIPKFIAELKKTYNIDSKPIDNYTSAINNMNTAWFELRAELDSQFGVTDKVMNAYKAVTEGLDWVRNNLDQVEKAARITAIAMSAIAGPAIVSGLLTVTKLIAGLAVRFTLLNAVMRRNPLIMIGAFAASIAGAVGGLQTFGRELQVFEGQLGTVGDYLDVLWDDFAQTTQTVLGDLGPTISSMFDGFMDYLTGFEKDWDMSWESIRYAAVVSIDAIVDWFSKAGQELTAVAAAFTGNIMRDIYSIAAAINGVRKMFAPWIDDPVGGKQSDKGFEWFDKYFKGWEDIPRVSWQELQDQIAEIWNTDSGPGPGERAVRDVEAYMNALREEANRRATERIFNDPSRRNDIPGGKYPSTKPFELDPGGLGGGGEADGKAIKALQKRLEAMKAINDEIAKTKREIEGLSMSEYDLEQLNLQFAREEEVEKYAKALRKAGVETGFITQKSKELMAALQYRDEMKKTTEALKAMRDAMADAFQNVGDALWDAVGRGSEGMEILKKAALESARDILKTWWQLAAMNPLKNLLFGLNEPVLGGMMGFGSGSGSGFGGLLGKLFGGLFGMGGGFGGFSPWEMMYTSLVPGLYNKGGAFVKGVPMMNAKGNVFSTPQTFGMAGGGVGRMAEMGTEAIMPLGRDSHGNLGVRSVEGGAGGGVTKIEIALSPELIASILQQAGEQSVQVSKKTVTDFTGSKEFDLRTVASVRKAANARML